MSLLSKSALGIACLIVSAPLSHAVGKILVMNDEWTLSNSGYFSSPASAHAFAVNIGNWITGGGAGTFHAYTGNFGLTQSSLAASLNGAGHTYTTGTAFAFTFPNIQAYDAIFLAGTAVDNNVLIQYVNAGGTVVLQGGTGEGGAGGEAAAWNTFLNTFGLGFASSYNGVGGNIPINSAHPLFASVTALYQNNGQDVSDLVVNDPAAVLVTHNGHNLYAVYEPDIVQAPESYSTWILLSLGLLLFTPPIQRRQAA